MNKVAYMRLLASLNNIWELLRYVNCNVHLHTTIIFTVEFVTVVVCGVCYDQRNVVLAITYICVSIVERLKIMSIYEENLEGTGVFFFFFLFFSCQGYYCRKNSEIANHL